MFPDFTIKIVNGNGTVASFAESYPHDVCSCKYVFHNRRKYWWFFKRFFKWRDDQHKRNCLPYQINGVTPANVYDLSILGTSKNLQVYKNGILQLQGSDYIENGNTLIFYE